MLAATLSVTAQDLADSLLERVQQGDGSAVLEMGQSADPKAIGALLPLLHDPNYKAKREARLALAKLGSQQQLQYFACRSLTGRLFQIQELMQEDLDYIGGDFSIEVYRQLLDSDQRFLDSIGRSRNGSDILITPPSSQVLARLSKLAPTSSIPNPSPLDIQAGRDKDIKSKWRIWIDSNQSELQKLKPTAEGIVFDPGYCSEFTTPAIDRRLRAIAGQGAINCGRVQVGGTAAKANDCAKKAFSDKKAFYVQYDVHELDEDISTGIGSDGQGNVFVAGFDDAGVSASRLGDQAEVLDEGRTVIVPCPTPIRFQPSVSNGLTCLVRHGNMLLSPE